MRDLLAPHDYFGLEYVKLSELCPNCYRPFPIQENGSPDVVEKLLFMLEVISYVVFLMGVWFFLVVVLFLPANITRLSNYLSSVTTIGSETTEDKVRKSAMFRTETNDVYRAKVREASREEEDQEQVVKRIDRNVDKLEKTLLSKPVVDSSAMAGTVADLDTDEFETLVNKMRTEVHRRFEELKEKLESLDRAARTNRI